MTANAAAQRPDLDLKLVLLAPAFGYADLIVADHGEAGLAAWEAAGAKSFHPPGWEAAVSWPWSLWERSRPLSWPAVRHPAAILHGSGEDVVPTSPMSLGTGAMSARALAQRRSC